MARLLRVVVADDEPSMLELVAIWLGELGHAVTAVDGGRPLVAACRADPPDLVVSDVRMPDLDGLTAAEQIRGELGLPVVLSSADWSDADRVRAAAVGAVVLEKPFRPLALATAVAAAGRGIAAAASGDVNRGR